MKRLILIIAILLCAGSLMGQIVPLDSITFYPFWGSGYSNGEPVITDSVVWRTVSIDSLNLGKEDCNHIWIVGAGRYPNNTVGCLVDHNGFHCDWDDALRDRICCQCLRKETQREFWYQHRKKHIETEYEKLEKKLKEKKK